MLGLQSVPPKFLICNQGLATNLPTSTLIFSHLLVLDIVESHVFINFLYLVPSITLTDHEIEG